ncbi:MAG: cob(I)yrinic acid a,c-diamide adenosyltransferase [Syntrophaceae bacterium]|nr:cob(I)yrinic acid a,c-diamide adenosyltransferase [Syntrophaceae bacterium]
MPDVGRVLLFTGDGKGKTTAALGMALRASGHGMRIKIVQFIKAAAMTGEVAAVQKLAGVEFVQTGLGFVPPADHPDFYSHQDAAAHALQIAAKAIQSQAYDMIILDEICNAVDKKLIKEDDVLAMIRSAGNSLCLVLTGRKASDGLIAAADTVTVMQCRKHGFQENIPAQKGVEY